MIGKVISFSASKGYGFIAPAVVGEEQMVGAIIFHECKDLFVHFSNIQMDGFKVLKPDQVVEYELGENHKGKQAINVRVVNEQ